jgi:hypothetical protein
MLRLLFENVQILYYYTIFEGKKKGVSRFFSAQIRNFVIMDDLNPAFFTCPAKNFTQLAGRHGTESPTR